MRDAISILERCSQESCEEITIDLVKEFKAEKAAKLSNTETIEFVEKDIDKKR